MSYIQSVIQCGECGKKMNVAFGIVGTSIIAEWPRACPQCNGSQFTKIADEWQYDPVPAASLSQEHDQ